jgi:hypothetical protein
MDLVEMLAVYFKGLFYEKRQQKAKSNLNP